MLYRGHGDLVAHECILDLRGLSKDTGVSVDECASAAWKWAFLSSMAVMCAILTALFFAGWDLRRLLVQLVLMHLGLAFPAKRGGLLRWADSLGAKEVLGRLSRLEYPGDRFRPTDRLLRMAETGETFHPPS